MVTQHIVVEHNCPLCNSEREGEAQALYLQWCESSRLARWFSLDESLVDDHAKHKGWDFQRAEDTASFYRAMIRVGGHHFLKNPHKLRSETIAMAARQLDKIEGREQQARKNDADFERDADRIRQQIHASIDAGAPPQEVIDLYTQTFPEYSEVIQGIEHARRQSRGVH